MLVSENWFLFISFTIGLVFKFVLNKRKREIEIENSISPLECHVENDENVISTNTPPPPTLRLAVRGRQSRTQRLSVLVAYGLPIAFIE